METTQIRISSHSWTEQIYYGYDKERIKVRDVGVAYGSAVPVSSVERIYVDKYYEEEIYKYLTYDWVRDTVPGYYIPDLPPEAGPPLEPAPPGISPMYMPPRDSLWLPPRPPEDAIPVTYPPQEIVAEELKPCEVIDRIRKLHYIYAEDDYLVGIYVVNTDRTGRQILSDTMYYVHQDRLSSYDVVALPDGEVKENLSYDVWGNRVLWDDWSEKEALVTDHLFHRGYTQHEHLNGFGIINMNGRIYDPTSASFFSPDPFVVDATSTQSFNRYSYCLNNPLMYTDPSGEFIQYIIGAISGAISGWQIGDAMGAKGWKMAGYIFGGAAIGAASAGVGTYVSNAIGTTTSITSAVGIATGGATSGIISGAGFTALAGGNANQIFNAAWKAGLSGALGSVVGTQIGGGTGAFIGGGISAGVNTGLNGGNGSDILKASLFGGGFSWAAYQTTQYYGWKQSGSDLTFSQFKEINIAAQKSFIKQREYGGWIIDNDIDMWAPGNRTTVQPTNRDAATINGEFHTHPDGTEGFSNIDYAGFAKDYGRKGPSNALVVARQNVYKYGGSLPIGNITYNIPFTLYPSIYHNPYFVSAYYYYNKNYFLNLRGR